MKANKIIIVIPDLNILINHAGKGSIVAIPSINVVHILVRVRVIKWRNNRNFYILN